MCAQTNSIANGRPFEISEKTDYVLIACQICIFQKIAGQRFAVELTDLVKSTRLLHPPIDSSLHGPHIYQNFHHATDSDNAEISKPPNEAKAIEHTQIGKCHNFLQVIPIISNRPLSIEKKCLLGLWMRHNFVKKGYC